jgi:gamma-glutamyl-gamma-aminobutyrate hydrolase PuuD
VASNGSDPARADSHGGSGPPVVGLTTYGEQAAWGVWDTEAVLLPRSYPDMVVNAGGVPVLIPPFPEAAAAVDRLDALVLSGGPDIAPYHYGALPHPDSGLPRPERDATELAVLRRALELGIPVLGVCRGAQLLNVALGGTLLQHLPEQVGHTGHNPSPGVFGTIAITLDEGSRASAALGRTVTAQCHHHQAIDRLAEGLVVTGRAGDGTIEAVETADGQQFVLGVQWHPERDDPRLFTALVRAARSPQHTSQRAEQRARQESM